MTDAREIIAKALQDWFDKNSFVTYQDAADVAVAGLDAAGIRIIGKDEVDQVTVEKCAEVATEAYACNDDWDYFYAAECAIETAIRSIGRKA